MRTLSRWIAARMLRSHPQLLCRSYWLSQHTSIFFLSNTTIDDGFATYAAYTTVARDTKHNQSAYYDYAFETPNKFPDKIPNAATILRINGGTNAESYHHFPR